MLKKRKIKPLNPILNFQEADPFLRAHKIAACYFDIGGRISPISIRDQMLRARTFVHRAFEEGLLEHGSRLLIIGGGAAGATAAICGAELEIHTILIERTGNLFGRQAKCRTRWVDPTQYDWPATHWKKGKYHWCSPEVPLSWYANFAYLIADRWKRRFKTYINKSTKSERKLSDFLQVRKWTQLVLTKTGRLPISEPDENGLVTVRLENLAHLYAYEKKDVYEEKVNIVLSCAGFGGEQCSLSPPSGEKSISSGFEFWET